MTDKELTLFTELAAVWLERNGMESTNVALAIENTTERTGILVSAAENQEITRRLLSRIG